MDRFRVGILHPGSMGSTVGAAASARAEVIWASDGRSSASAERARQAGLTDVTTLAQLVETSDVIISLVPPAAAEDLARRTAEAGFDGIYVEANAISPDRTGAVAAILASATVVDGGVVGPPALVAGTTRLYLSGADAPTVAELFAGSVIEAVAIGGEVGTASAMKMAYAAYTKGSTALLLAVRAYAEHHGLTDTLLAEWSRSIPDLPDRSTDALGRIPRKAWRFTGEMQEIAAAFGAAGLPAGFHLASADIFGRVGPEGPDADPTVVLDRIRNDAG